MQIADKRRSTWRVPVDSYRGVICLIGAREREEEDEQTCSDGDGREEIFHKCFYES